MIHGHENLFVGIIAIALGLALSSCAVTNSDWYYSLRSARWLARVLGRNGARIFHTLLGLALMTLGIAIALGHRWTLVGS